MHHFLATLTILLAITGCGGADTAAPEAPPTGATGPAETQAANEFESALTAITLTIGSQSFAATLIDTDAAQALTEQFPLTLPMSEMNGNEKYFYLDDSLPTDPETPGQIAAGDILLYGDDCLVLFYESLQSTYQYTRLGSVDDPAGLAEALGAGDATVVWALA